MNPSGKTEPVRAYGSVQITSVTFQCDGMEGEQMISATVVALVTLEAAEGAYYEELEEQPTLSYRISDGDVFMPVKGKLSANRQEYTWENVGPGEFVAGTQYTFRVDIRYRRIILNQTAYGEANYTANCP